MCLDGLLWPEGSMPPWVKLADAYMISFLRVAVKTIGYLRQRPTNIGAGTWQKCQVCMLLLFHAQFCVLSVMFGEFYGLGSVTMLGNGSGREPA